MMATFQRNDPSDSPKWLIFGKQHLQMHFAARVSIGSNGGLALTRQQAITWTQVVHVLWHHMVSLVHNEFCRHFLKKIWVSSLKMSWKFVPKDPIDLSAVVQVIGYYTDFLMYIDQVMSSWHHIGARPSVNTMLTWLWLNCSLSHKSYCLTQIP